MFTRKLCLKLNCVVHIELDLSFCNNEVSGRIAFLLWWGWLWVSSVAHTWTSLVYFLKPVNRWVSLLYSTKKENIQRKDANWIMHVPCCFCSTASEDTTALYSEIMMYVLLVFLTFWLLVEMVYCYRKISKSDEQAQDTAWVSHRDKCTDVQTQSQISVSLGTLCTLKTNMSRYITVLTLSSLWL